MASEEIEDFWHWIGHGHWPVGHPPMTLLSFLLAKGFNKQATWISSAFSSQCYRMSFVLGR